MKKRLFPLVLLIAAVGLSQGSASISNDHEAGISQQEFTAVAGLAWGITPDQAMKILVEKGAVPKGAVSAQSTVCDYPGGSFAGLPVTVWQLSFFDEKLYRVKCQIDWVGPEMKGYVIFAKMKADLTEKYGKPAKSSQAIGYYPAKTYYESTPTTDDQIRFARFLTEMQTGKLQPRMAWFVGNVNNIIKVSLVSPTSVVASYEWGALQKEMEAAAETTAKSSKVDY